MSGLAAGGIDDRTDAEIIEQVLAGRQELFAVLVRRYQAPLYRHALGMLGQPDAAADIVQDTLVKAYTRLGSCRESGAFATWLFRIGRNTCLDHLKSIRRRTVPLEEVTLTAPASDGPEHQLATSEINGTVAVALRTLSESQREAFLMKHVEGLSYEEMAERLDTSVSALKMRVKRAREELQGLLRGLRQPGEGL